MDMCWSWITARWQEHIDLAIVNANTIISYADNITQLHCYKKSLTAV